MEVSTQGAEKTQEVMGHVACATQREGVCGLIPRTRLLQCGPSRMWSHQLLSGPGAPLPNSNPGQASA